MDSLSTPLVQYLAQLPNSVVNSIYEEVPPPPELAKPVASSIRSDPPQNSSRYLAASTDLTSASSNRVQWLRAKYVDRRFVTPYSGTFEALQNSFYEVRISHFLIPSLAYSSQAVLRGQIPAAVRLLAQGATVDGPPDVPEPFHVALEKRLLIVVEMLLLWGRDVNQPLEDGRPPLHVAITHSVRGPSPSSPCSSSSLPRTWR